MAVLSIDQGTSGTKAVVIGDENLVLAKGFCGINVSHSASGESQVNADQIWNSVLQSVNQALAASNTSILAVALANQGESILAWDKKTGTALTPVIIWQDSRSASLCQDRQSNNEFVLNKTGLTIDPYFVAPKIAWLRNQYPNLPKDAVITTTDSWLIFLLTREFVTDRATASRTLLFDLESKNWQQKLADIWQIDILSLPKLINNDQIVGPINNKEFPKLYNVPLAAAIVDQPAALFAQNCFSAGQVKCTYGTGAFLLTNIGDKVKISKNGLATSLAWDIKESTSYYFDGQVFTAASAIDWLIANKYIEQLSDIDKLPDSDGVIASPSFSGIGAPLWRPNATASIAGLGLNHSKGHIASAIVDGIAAAVAHLLQMVNADGVSINTLRVDGGLVQSGKLMQMQANLAQVEVEIFAHPDATAIGVANLAQLAMNPSLSITDISKLNTPSKKFQPIWSKDQAAAYLNRWQLLQNSTLERQ